MINERTGNEIDYLNWKVILISVITIIIMLAIMVLPTLHIYAQENIDLGIRVVIMFLYLDFSFNRIVGRASEGILSIIDALSQKKGFAESIPEFIPKEEEK